MLRISLIRKVYFLEHKKKTVFICRKCYQQRFPCANKEQNLFYFFIYQIKRTLHIPTDLSV